MVCRLFPLPVDGVSARAKVRGWRFKLKRSSVQGSSVQAFRRSRFKLKSKVQKLKFRASGNARACRRCRCLLSGPRYVAVAVACCLLTDDEIFVATRYSSAFGALDACLFILHRVKDCPCPPALGVVICAGTTSSTVRKAFDDASSWPARVQNLLFAVPAT
ncbi:hypothetical protein BJ912DRAFT_591574 [Pholiota molesta]|nr:hypothetical protein BJ912DRAFT_591574 [Pholiota molesta]